MQRVSIKYEVTKRSALTTRQGSYGSDVYEPTDAELAELTDDEAAELGLDLMYEIDDPRDVWPQLRRAIGRELATRLERERAVAEAKARKNEELITRILDIPNSQWIHVGRDCRYYGTPLTPPGPDERIEARMLEIKPIYEELCQRMDMKLATERAESERLEAERAAQLRAFVAESLPGLLEGYDQHYDCSEAIRQALQDSIASQAESEGLCVHQIEWNHAAVYEASAPHKECFGALERVQRFVAGLPRHGVLDFEIGRIVEYTDDAQQWGQSVNVKARYTKGSDWCIVFPLTG